MPITTENLTEEDVAIVRSTYKKYAKSSFCLAILMLILALIIFYLGKFETRDLFLIALTLFCFYLAFLSNRRSKTIDVNNIKEVMTGSFVQDRSGRGSRTLKIIVDDKEIYYNYQWAINTAGKKCGSFSSFIKGEDITVECFKLGNHQMMLRVYDDNQKGEKVMNEKPDQALLKQAIAKDEQTLANLLKLIGFGIPAFLGMGYLFYSQGLLAGIETYLIIFAVSAYSFGALAAMAIINFAGKKKINEKRKLLDDYNPLDNSTR